MLVRSASAYGEFYSSTVFALGNEIRCRFDWEAFDIHPQFTRLHYQRYYTPNFDGMFAHLPTLERWEWSSVKMITEALFWIAGMASMCLAFYLVI